MSTVGIIGGPRSNFVRTARMACHEKGVPYTLDAVFPHTPAVDAISPVGKIPVMRHGDLALAETRAICGYIDAAFDGPPLMPRAPAAAAVTEQWISLVTTSIDPALMRNYLLHYVFPSGPDGKPDRARIEAALPKCREMFALLEKELATHTYLGGDTFTLADMFLLPIIHYMQAFPESGEMLAAAPSVRAWHDRVAARPSARDTLPAPRPA